MTSRLASSWLEGIQNRVPEFEFFIELAGFRFDFDQYFGLFAGIFLARIAPDKTQIGIVGRFCPKNCFFAVQSADYAFPRPDFFDTYPHCQTSCRLYFSNHMKTRETKSDERILY